MADPIQTTNPQQQGQQWWYTDDILGGEDIFAKIPEAIHEEDLPYGDLLEKKYQFDPIPEAIQTASVPVPQPVAAVQAQAIPRPQISVPVAPVRAVVQQAPIQAPVQQANIPEPQIVQNISSQEMQDIHQQSELEQTKVGGLLDTKLQTDVQKKFGELFFTTKKIYELKDKLGINEENFNILWADNDKIFVSYKFLLDETDDPIVFITKIEQDKETEEETANELRFTFNEEASSLEVMINDVILFDEVKDFAQDQKKKLQVIDKLNKFTFLASEEVRKIEKEIKEKEEAERERKRLQEIFRNF